MSRQPTLPGQKHIASHSRRGLDFEEDLDRTHMAYARSKIANVTKNPKEWRYGSESERHNILKSGQRSITATTDDGKVLIARKSKVDFSGNFGAFAIEFDAKETKGKSLDLKKNVSRNQLERLVLAEQTGGIAGLMIHFSDLGRVFFVQASVVDRCVIEMLFSRGRKSISLALCEQEAVEIPVRNNLVDWYSELKPGKCKNTKFTTFEERITG